MGLVGSVEDRDKVLEALRGSPKNGMTHREIWEVLGRTMPEGTLSWILTEFAHQGLVRWYTLPGRGPGRKHLTRLFELVPTGDEGQ